jgi:putative transposase
MEPGKVYHIYTHANGFENLFRSQENYRYFLERYTQFIPSIADTLTYCLMPNHIHFLVRIKTKEQIIDYFNLRPLNSNSSEVSNPSRNSSEVSKSSE